MKWHEALEYIWHWLTTSRYTRRIESENAWLLRDNDRLRAENHVLLLAIHPQLKAARTEYEVTKESKAEEYKPFKF